MSDLEHDVVIDLTTGSESDADASLASSAPITAPITWIPMSVAAERSGHSRKTLRRWAQQGKVRGELHEGEWRFDSKAEAFTKALAHLAQGTAQGSPDVPQGDAPPPPGQLLVPLDAWTRMLDQLGHLHEAGQQLAEARERAAKAETEATFLRAQLADLRSRMPPPPAPPAPMAQGTPTVAQADAVGAHGQRRRWWRRSPT